MIEVISLGLPGTRKANVISLPLSFISTSNQTDVHFHFQPNRFYSTKHVIKTNFAPGKKGRVKPSAFPRPHPHFPLRI